MQITTGNFNKALGDLARGVGTQRGRIQEFIVFGCEYAAANNGNMLYVSTLTARLVDAKGINTSKLIGYVKRVCAVTYGKDKAGNMVFLPINEAKREGRPLVDMTLLNAEKWYDHEKAKKEPTVATIAQRQATIEKWAAADADTSDPDAIEWAKLMVAYGKIAAGRVASANLSKAA